MDYTTNPRPVHDHMRLANKSRENLSFSGFKKLDYQFLFVDGYVYQFNLT